MEIKLDAEAAASIASAAIFQSLSQEYRDQVIQQAVQHLISPKPDPRGMGRPAKSPLQDAFDAALTNAAYKAVQEKIKDDPIISAHISELLGPLLNAALEGEAESWNTELADRLGQALGSWLAEKARERN